MNYNIISTGSKGNAVIFDDIVLIDCGVPFKRLKPFYKDLKAVCLTHIHKDHFNTTTISRLAKERPTLRFICCEHLLNNLLKCGVKKRNIDVLEIGKMYDYKEFKLSPIKLYHDVSNVGYRLVLHDHKILYATDTQHLNGISAKNYDYYFIEANYEEQEINQKIAEKEQAGQFIYEKRVVKTHLSKEQTDEFLLENMGENSRYVYLHQHED